MMAQLRCEEVAMGGFFKGNRSWGTKALETLRMLTTNRTLVAPVLAAILPNQPYRKNELLLVTFVKEQNSFGFTRFNRNESSLSNTALHSINSKV